MTQKGDIFINEPLLAALKLKRDQVEYQIVADAYERWHDLSDEQALALLDQTPNAG